MAALDLLAQQFRWNHGSLTVQGRQEGASKNLAGWRVQLSFGQARRPEERILERCIRPRGNEVWPDIAAGRRFFEVPSGLLSKHGASTEVPAHRACTFGVTNSERDAKPSLVDIAKGFFRSDLNFAGALTTSRQPRVTTRNGSSIFPTAAMIMLTSAYRKEERAGLAITSTPTPMAMGTGTNNDQLIDLDVTTGLTVNLIAQFEQLSTLNPAGQQSIGLTANAVRAMGTPANATAVGTLAGAWSGWDEYLGRRTAPQFPLNSGHFGTRCAGCARRRVPNASHHTAALLLTVTHRSITCGSTPCSEDL